MKRVVKLLRKSNAVEDMALGFFLFKKPKMGRTCRAAVLPIHIISDYACFAISAIRLSMSIP